MGNHRLLLYFTLFFISYLLWAQWQMDYGPKPVDTDTVASERSVERTGSEDAGVPLAGVPDTPKQKTVSVETGTIEKTSQRIKVITDVVEVEIDTRGGDIRKLTLRNYAVEADKPDIKLDLLSEKEMSYHVAQSGLVSVNAGSAPTHNANYAAEQFVYRLGEGENEIRVPLHWSGENGEKVTKTFIFNRGDYTINVSHSIIAGNSEWSGSQYMQLVRASTAGESESTFIRSYAGGVIYNDEIKYEKYDYDDIAEETLNQELKDGWLAMLQHYFLAAWVPEKNNTNLYYSRHNARLGHYTLGTRSPAQRLKPGEKTEFSARLVAGPKLQYRLEEIEPGLELTVDYGVLTIIAKPLFWLLDIYHGWFNNWGWAIIFLTITVKAIFYKLSEMSYRSMAKMRKVAPRIKQMKEKYGDDRQGMSKAMMEMYKREKINPMGGCFPILVQIPVFISLYWVLLESVEMRHAPFALWIDNLSAMDPYFVLPVMMGVSMFIQQKLNPAPIDPVQQKVFQIMPFAFTIMFAFFPSGLVLYWVVNNILSITQQWIITKRIENS
jgi:YidC/Oxa1 family membrane protein insertase